MARSSSHFTPRNAFQLRIALRACAFVSFFRGASWYIRRNTISGPFCSHVKTSPGAAPGSTTRFLLSAVNLIVGLSHIAVHAVKARSGMDRFKSESENSRFALRVNLVSCRPVQSVATPQKSTWRCAISARRRAACGCSGSSSTNASVISSTRCDVNENHRGAL